MYPDWFDIENAAVYMGRTEDELLRMIMKGNMPATVLRFSRAALDTFMKDHTYYGDIKASTLSKKEREALDQKGKLAFVKGIAGRKRAG